MQNKDLIAFDDLAFSSAADLKWHIAQGCEIEFIWKGKSYSITHPDGLFDIGEGYYIKEDKAYNVLSHTECNPDNRLRTENIDAVLEYLIDGDRLRDIATKIGIVDRTL